MQRRARSKTEISMFPFLSVLCSMIGVMILLMILVLSSRAVEVDQTSAAAPPTKYIPAPEKPVQTGLPDEEYKRLQAQIHELTSQLARRKQELSELDRLILELEELIAAKEDQDLKVVGGEGLVAGVKLDEKQKVVHVPVTGSVRVTKKPRFVEVQAAKYIVHPEKTSFPLSDLNTTNSPLQKFLQQMEKNGAKEYLVLLIHPNGAKAYLEFMECLQRNHKDRIDVGKEPFREDWLVFDPTKNNAADN